MDLGKIIKNYRKAKKLTQEEFASLCGITQTYLSQIESNSKEPNLSTLKEISSQLEIPLPILFFLSLNDEDLNPEKKELFLSLSPKIKNLVNEYFEF